MRYAVYVSGTAGRLRKLLAGGPEQLLKDIELVFSDDVRNSDLVPILAGRNIAFHCLDHLGIPPGHRSIQVSDRLLSLLREHRIDHCFCFGDRILKGAIIDEYRSRIINFHPSLLPSFPGRMAIDQALQAGARLLGNTAHFIDAGVDTGPIILQSVVPVSVFHEKGYDGVLDVQLGMLERIHRWLEQGRIVVRDGEVVIAGASPGGIHMFPNDLP